MTEGESVHRLPPWFNQATRAWFAASFPGPTRAQLGAWGAIGVGRSALVFAPTGSGKTLAAFLAAIDRLMFSAEPPKAERCRVLYVSPLKALGNDVEKNLRAPLAGIAAKALELGVPFRAPTVAVRSGDTPANERARMARTPPDVLITTPESIYLLLTSNAREALASVDTVIIDEIHALVPSKRGVHLFLSLERLEAQRGKGAPALQRIGLSATQRPLDEVARLLGGGVVGPGGVVRPRPVTIVDAGTKKAWDLKVEVPLDDLASLGADKPGDPDARSVWPSVHRRIVELVRAHRSTMIFTNSRRLAERLAGAVNDLAGEEIALAHHGSVAKETRLAIEDRLKRGELPAIVATSSLELGIDVGAVDLVIQVEAPPSVASGLQRVGRAGHSVGAVSRGVVFPKFRGDLLAAAAVTARMAKGEVEESFYPRCPLDVLAQQIVAMVAMEPLAADAVFDLVRQAAPFAELPRASFDGVLDMLSGRYPSDEFADLRPRITWDRATGLLTARSGAKRLAIVNGGTIPDRGLYGVYLGTESAAKSQRVGELDEEMVFESKAGDVFLLGASSWRITEITHDRVLVTPAPGEPGKMPFWRGDRPGRPPELGRAIGALARTLAAEAREPAMERLRGAHGLDERAADNLWRYVRDQAAATGEVPSDRAIVVERVRDAVGDLRVCVLSPFGGRVHAPWCTVVLAALREAVSGDVEGISGEDGMVFRLPFAEKPPSIELFLPKPDAVEDRLVQALGGSSLFAARFRENAARALLLPRRFPGQRSPLWATRKRASDLFAVASRFGSFPIVLETVRECLRDVFDLPGLVELLAQIEAKAVRTVVVDSLVASPFASSLMFGYVGNFLYDGDAPLAERRAQALRVDPSELKRLLGEAEIAELLDPEAIASTERSLQRLDPARHAKTADGVHDLLLGIGDLALAEVAARVTPAEAARGFVGELLAAGRVIEVTIAGETRIAAVEDASRLRDALGVKIPTSVPEALRASVEDPIGDLVSRFARTHGPFSIDALVRRLGLAPAVASEAIARLVARGRLASGALSPGTRAARVCDAEVMRRLKQEALARARRAVEPVPPEAFARFLLGWQGVERPRSGPDALLAVVEQLEGAPLLVSALESRVLPARVKGYLAGDLDRLCAMGQVAWVGLESVGANDGKIAIFLPQSAPLLAPAPRVVEGELPARVRAALVARGAVFFHEIVTETGAFPPEVLAALWELVWAGEVTNDTLAPLRRRLDGSATEEKARRASVRSRSLTAFQASRRAGPPGSEGRWSLTRAARPSPTETERRAALTRSLLDRHGVLTREAVPAEGVAGGFSAVYDVLKALEERAEVRRGYFVAGLGATQFAVPGADDALRAARDGKADSPVVTLAATDPANPYGAALPWPEPRLAASASRPQRSAGAEVILRDGRLLGFLGRSAQLLTFAGLEPESEASRSLAKGLASLVDAGDRATLLIEVLDGEEATTSPFAGDLRGAGFSPTSKGLFKRRGASS